VAPAPEPAVAASAAGQAAPQAEAPAAPVTLQQVKDSWPQILETLEKLKRSAWMVLATAQVRELRDGNVLVLTLPSQRDVDDLKDRSNPGKGTADFLKKAVAEILGFNPLLIAKVDAEASAPAPARVAAPTSTETATPATDATGWATVAIPGSEPRDEDAPPPDEPPTEESPAARRSEPAARQAAPSAPSRPATTKQPRPQTATDRSRYGESVVREILGASFIEEQPHNPRVTPGAN
jgi:DNA polymerase-3 subunit gamma/tau